MKLRIYITAEDIRWGDRDNCNACPVALATKRVFHTTGNGIVGHMDVSCHSIDLWTEEGKHWLGLQTPEIESFIDSFDGGEEVVPFSTEIELVEQQ